ncbi:protein of unknown function [Denitratisoma oestradiolicum]|uniref:Uncharacterized protein n=1 Tax=Denitratisoma oestradiolicum TaxID=311182 RepID=A0A6S6XWX4_9PROT|nr:protein of unknown function [Denitratisoma oestradiolicum]
MWNGWALTAKTLAEIQESDVRKMLDALADDMATLDRDHLKDFIGTLIEGIYLDPATRAGRSVIGSPSEVGLSWRPHGDSNPGSHRERVLS